MKVHANLCVVILGCPDSDPNNPCRIALPLRIPRGKCDDQHSLPIDAWPATFLCLHHGLVSVRQPHNVRRFDEILDQDQPMPSLWKIECVCAHENCSRPHTIYASREKDWEGIVKAIIRCTPKIPCEGHDLVWREDLMRPTEIAHDSPMR
jgi:hypothetical protein